MTSLESFYWQMPQVAEDETRDELASLVELVGPQNLLDILETISYGITESSQE